MTPALLTVALSAAPRLWAPGPVGQTTRERLHVFVEVDSPVTFTLGDAGVRCENGARFLLDGGATLAHCSVALAPGVNTFTAASGPADGGERVTATLSRYVTTGPLPPELDRAGFGPGAVHRPEVEAACARCHRLEPPDAGAAASSFCATCHAEIMQRPVMHGPVQQGACLACHDAASTPARYAVRWPIQETCFGCHVDVKATMDRKAVRHGPAAAGRCTTCHDPHGTDQPYWLKLRAYDLCTNCHTEKRGERHVVVGFVYGDSHPLQGRPHPLKERTEFACPSCHNPHAAQARFLWQFDVTTRDSLCRTCHQK